MPFQAPDLPLVSLALLKFARPPCCSYWLRDWKARCWRDLRWRKLHVKFRLKKSVNLLRNVVLKYHLPGSSSESVLFFMQFIFKTLRIPLWCSCVICGGQSGTGTSFVSEYATYIFPCQCHSTNIPHPHFINLSSTLFNLSYRQRRYKTHNKLLQDTQRYLPTSFFRYHSMALKMVTTI